MCCCRAQLQSQNTLHMPCKAREAAAFCLFEDSLAVQGTAFFQQVEAGSPPRAQPVVKRVKMAPAFERLQKERLSVMVDYLQSTP
jgi:hypothetical protein